MVEQIIDRFGGAAALAAALGMEGRDAGAKVVRAWKRRQSIPAKWFAPIARAAASRGFVDITNDFLAASAETKQNGASG